MMKEGTRIDVECVGGPLDGHRTDVALNAPGFDVFLFHVCHAGGQPAVMAYAMAGTTTDKGRRWVLRFLYEVAKVGSRKTP